MRRQGSGRAATGVCRAQKVSDLPASLKKIVGAFQMVPDPMARYKQLLFYATKLAPLPAEDHVPANKVEGCVSQVWVVPEMRDDGLIYWRADSDSQLTKGLAALLVTGLSGCTPAEILTVQPDFIEMLGLKQSLTPSRNNGFLNMFRLMQRKTLELVAASVSGASAAAAPTGAEAAPQAAPAAAPAPASSTNGASTNGASASAPAPPPPPPAAAAAASSSRTPLQDGMRRKLTEALKPSVLTIIDESAQHAGHAAMMVAKPGKAGGPGETHFKVELVSEAFEGLTQVKRQRMVYQLLADEFNMGLHALALVTRTPAEAAK
ncbi:hypothetical protein HXX76_013043 [Chlamydomonas incerta]|uniref:Fe-S metabolism associated domain-containing protein n=1 Tax=Chlamydomonas incerta TaxID=51695 RepID=A0A835SIQ9_CHLIN|nr:hypothetical protein HXX76_013043 [Chlamydomonas incerta]|eukprot:KAG2426286.1 hypothetical protein HXX76_013043 [Chlamydomonas incerta]